MIMWIADRCGEINWALILAVLAVTVFLCQQAEASACRVAAHSWRSMISERGGGQGGMLQKIYSSEGLSCYVGDVGTSFGPFQLHYGSGGWGNKSRGMGNVFTEQTGLNARNRSTVPAQIRFMVRWGAVHGFSSDIWHGLRTHHRLRHGHHHWRHWHGRDS
jgi:hypothetical protein